MNGTRPFLTLVLALCVWSAAQAGVIRSPVDAVVDVGGEFSSIFDIGNTIDQSGLSTTFTSGVTDFDTYIGRNPLHDVGAPNQEWFTPQGVNSAVVTYDLGAAFGIGRLALWNEEAAGIVAFGVLISLDGASFSRVASGLAPTNNSGRAYPADIFALEPQNARFLRLEIDDCPQPGGFFDACSMGEIAFETFETFQTIPEPTTFALIGIGVAGLGYRRWTH